MNDRADSLPGHAVLAIDVGGTMLKAEVQGPDGSVWARDALPTSPGGRLVDQLAHTTKGLLARLPGSRAEQVEAVGVALPGLVDVERGISILAANLGLRDVSVVGPLAEQVRLPVRLGHDVTVAALAERTTGAAADVTDPVVVIIGTGVAAVSFVHGSRVRGVTGQAGELGHLVVRDDGPTCACGRRGCLEALASAVAISRAYEERSGRHVDGSRGVVALLGRDAVADQVWTEATGALADGLLMVSALLAPGAIVLGGGLAEAGDALLDPVREQIERRRSPALTVPRLVTARWGARAGVVGAAMLARGELA